MLKRKPDFIIGSPHNPYLLRWWLIPRNRFFNIYLHKFMRDDDDRALHDHPWYSCSVILKGGYIEIVPLGKAGENNGTIGLVRKPGRIVFRRATQAHRVRLFRKPMWYTSGNMEQVIPAWSLFITGPRIREWGFWCEGVRWIHWRDFVGVKEGRANGDEIGKGCEE